MAKLHTYTKEEIDYIKKIAPNCTSDEIRDKFNKKFNLNLSEKSLKGIRYRHGIKAGKNEIKNKFRKGNKPWNKGLKGIMTGGEDGWFKEGKEHIQYRPIGSERTECGKFVLVKVADPDIWVRKHYLIWEKAHGKVPEGHLVIFADGNKQNFDINNLILVTRGQLARLHKNHLMQDDSELTKAMLNVVKIHEAIDRRKEG